MKKQNSEKKSKTKKSSRKRLSGTVVQARGQKMIIVRVQRKFKHPIYEKFLTKSKKYYAHDEKNEAKIGDSVFIVESRPLSKLKRWVLLKVN